MMMSIKNNNYHSPCLSWLSLLVVTVVCAKQQPLTSPSSPFKIILDGGSTGSRLHVFEFVSRDDDDANTNEDDDGEHDKDAVVECVRRGSSRANIPLSAFGRLSDDQDQPLNATHVAEHLLPLFEYAAELIPPQYYRSTPVKYQATAGMRLLEESEQEAVYDALYDGLMEDPNFVFRGMQRDDIATLSGELEGFFGAVAANYLQGIVDAQLRFQKQQQQQQNATDQEQEFPSEGPVGALDMGGSSTQIVFLPDTQSSHETVETCSNGPQQQQQQQDDEYVCGAPASSLSEQQLKGEHFFSTSYLSYGVDQFRERLWSTLVAEHKREEEVAAAASSYDPDGSCVSKFVLNPCANKGYQVEWDGYTLIGTGETDECVRQTRRLIPHPEMAHDDEEHNQQKVGGIEHPPIRGKFLAMSLYFFSLDSLRVFSEPDREAHEALNLSWPNPSIEELHNALDGLCSRDWESDMAHQEGVHDFTRAEVLPHRCIETVYMVTLLKDGYGFHPSSRDITFTFLVDGSEVEWTLGMALSMNAEETATLAVDIYNDAPTITDTATASNSELSPREINRTCDDEQRGDNELESWHFQSTSPNPLFAVESL